MQGADPLIGRTFSHYRILAKLGRGGMGVVYEAEDLKLGRRVALKFLSESVAQSQTGRRRFELEARLASSLNHPNICTIHEIDQADGQTFIVMELVKGGTLADRIRGQGLPLDEVVSLAIEVCEALAAAHANGIVHRDIKSTNIFVTPEGHAKVADFGLAKLTVSPEDATLSEVATLTREGGVVGTLAYMSPEQARGEPLDGRSDVFSFGAVLYEMVTGRRAFTGDSHALLFDAVLNRTPTSPRSVNPQVPGEMEFLLGKALEKDRVVRYQSVQEMLVDLKRLKRNLESGSGAAIERSAEAKGNNTFFSKPLVVTVGVLGLALGALVGGWLIVRRPAPEPEITQLQLTANPSEIPLTAAAISPDGKYLAYADPRGAYLRLIKTGETRALPMPKQFAVSALAWVPDGTRILASGDQGGQNPSLWTISILGTAPQKLRDDAGGPAVSPDGSTIAFLGNFDSGYHEIWLMDANGEEPRKLGTARAGEDFLRVAWSPDGQRIAYLKATGAQADVVIESLGLKGGAPTRIVSDPSLQDLCWLPDGRMLYSLVREEMIGADSNLWAVKVDAQTGQPTSKPKQITNWVGFSFSQLTLTGDGKRLAFLKRTAESDVYVGELEARDTRLKAIYRLTLNERNDWPVDWTADGKSVVFWSDRNGTWDLFKQGLNEDSPELLPGGPEPKWYSHFSPGGSWFLYMALPKAEPPYRFTPVRLMRVPASGGPSHSVLSAFGMRNFHCARPPVSLCVYDEREQNQRVFTSFDPVLGKGRELARIPANVSGLWDISPDGSRLAIAEPDPHEGHIQLLSLNGGTSSGLVVKGWNNFDDVTWSADGKGFFVDAAMPDGGALLHVDLHGHADLLWKEKGIFSTCGRPSPDGRYLATAGWTTNSNAWVIENF
jgi:Tol biopolymer transport system component/tRNA A-37 threonylcarbamoyl transferase component Bud32